MLYKDKIGESTNQAFFSVIVVSSAIVCFHLIGVYLLLNYFGLIPIIMNRLYIAFLMLSVGFINYFFFIREKKFLKYGFEKDRKGGVLIVTYLLLLCVICIFIGNKNRERIFSKSGSFSDKPKRESLEGKIRKWFNN